MTAWRHTRRSNLLLVVALGLVGAGFLSVGVYVFGALAVVGEADQSMLFWLLPFLFFGLTAAGVGVVLAVLWLLMVSSDASRSEPAPIERRSDDGH